MLISEKRALQEQMGYSIRRGDDWDISHSEFLYKDEAGAKKFLLTKLPIKITQDNEITYRQINYWTEQGLFDDNREDNSQWRRYSVSEGIWLRVIWILRSFGLSKQQLKMVKDTLFLKDEDGESKLLFEYYLSRALVGSNVNIYVFSNGVSEILFDGQWQICQSYFKKKHPYITVNINEIVYNIFKWEIMKPKNTNYISPNMNEWKVLVALNNKKYKSIEIVLKNGEVQRMNTAEEVDLKQNQKIIDLVKAKDYQRITIEVENGKTANIEIINKEKF